MILRTLALLLVVALSATAQKVRRADFDTEIEDWHLIDLDGDGRREILVFFDDTEAGKPFRVVRRPAKGGLVVGELGHLPARTVAIALRRPLPKKPLELILLSPTGTRRAVFRDAGFEIGPETSSGLTPFFRAALSGPPPIWHWELDINADKAGDLMVPCDEGVAIARGQEDGTLGPFRTLPLPGQRSLTESAPEAYRFTRTLPHPVFRDVDADGRPDLTWFDGRGLGYARQLASGDFAPAELFTLPWLSEATGGLVEKTDITMRDADGDGRNDLILSRMRADPERVTDMKTTVVLLRNQGGTSPFARRPDQALVIPGVAGVGPTLLDCDGDGRDDLVVGSYGSKLSDAVSRFLGGIPLEFRIFRGEKEGFAKRPMSSSKIAIGSRAFSDLGARHCARIVPDLDGDGIVDLVLMIPRGKRQMIALKPGRREPSLSFAEKPTATFTTRDYQAMSDIADSDPSGPTELLLAGKRRFELLNFRK